MKQNFKHISDKAADGPSDQNVRSSYGLFSLAVGTAFAALLLDLMFPLGVAGGITQTAPVLVGLALPNRRQVFLITLLGASLIFAGYFLSPPGGVFWVVVINRTLALLAVLAAGLIIYNTKKNKVGTSSYEANAEANNLGVLKIFGSGAVTFGFLALLSVIGLTFYASKETESSRTWMTHTREVQGHISHVLSLVQDLETGQRGFLLTGKETYLEPFNNAVTDVYLEVSNLKTLTRDNSRQQEKFVLLNRLIEEKVAELNKTILLYRTEGMEPALDMVRTDSGKQIMDQIRVALDDMNAEEEGLLASRQKLSDTFRYYTLAAYGLAILLIIGVAAFIANRIQGFVAYKKKSDATLKIAKKEADAANKAKSQFLSSMSHELRTPLNAIIGFAQVLDKQSGSMNEIQRNSVRYIQDGGEHLLNLISEVLELAKIESGNLELSIENIPVAKVVGPSIMMAETLGHKFGIKVINGLSDTSPTTIMADLTSTRQILLNLLSNAVKYNRPSGSVTLTCEQGADGMVRFSVTDTGLGIAADQMERLFKPFDRLENKNSAIEGTGIGLTITKELLESMNGRIGVESTAGEGSIFWFELPATDDAVLSTGQEANDRLSGVVSNVVTTLSLTSNKRIFYIEDNPTNIDLMQVIISEVPKLTLDTAETAEEGLTEIKKNPPDLVLMDINLPGMNGLEATRILKLDATTQHIPVLGVSANAMSDDVETAKKAGFDRYITKPFNIDEIMGAIAMALNAEMKPVGTVIVEPSTSPAEGDEGISDILSAEIVNTIKITRQKLPEAYVVALRNMFETIPQLEEEIHAALTEENAKSVESAAHRLKTNSSTLGAVELSSWAQKIESAASNGNLEMIHDYLPEINKEYTRVTLAIKQLLS